MYIIGLGDISIFGIILLIFLIGGLITFSILFLIQKKKNNNLKNKLIKYQNAELKIQNLEKWANDKIVNLKNSNKKLKNEFEELEDENIELLSEIKYLKQQNEELTKKSTPTYTKKYLLTDYEKKFYKILKNNYENKYTIQTQVNLLSIINKNTNEKYRNELFRNIDFGIFDKNTLEPLVMIELNDKTHKEQERYKRDLKVREILKESNIPLITFYSDYPNKESYIIKKINEVLYKC